MNKNYDYPNIMSLSSSELIKWCNERKKQMHLSNAKLALASNVPEGTIDRILTGKNPEFRYSTIQPIIKILLEFDKQTPTDKDQDYYANIIDGYKLAVDNKNYVIDKFKETYQYLMGENESLKNSNAEKQKIIEGLMDHIKWLEKNYKQ